MWRPNLAKKMTQPGTRLRRWHAMSVGARISALFVLTLVAIAILAGVIAPFGPREVLSTDQPPGWPHLLGTTGEGYDVLSSMIYGARYSISIGLGATIFGTVLGAIIGSSCGI